jgi:hypothetical protein
MRIALARRLLGLRFDPQDACQRSVGFCSGAVRIHLAQVVPVAVLQHTTNQSGKENLIMHVIAADTIVADIATELEMSPTEASLYLNDLLDDGYDDDSSDFDS